MSIRYVATLNGGGGVVPRHVTDVMAVDTARGSYVFTATMSGGGVSAFALHDAGVAAQFVGAQKYDKSARHAEEPHLVPLPPQDGGAAGGVSMVLTNLNGSGARGYHFSQNCAPAGRFDTGFLDAKSGGFSALTTVETPQGTLYAVALDGQAGFKTFLDGRPTADVRLSGLPAWGEVDFLRPVSAAHGTYLLAGSSAGNTLALYQVGDNGALRQTGAIGEGHVTGLSTPRDAVVVNVGAQTYVIVTGGQSSSLTSFRIAPDGRLVPVDHVIDELSTRFDQATAVATASVDGRSFVFVGGADHGISVFAVLPNGKLLYVDSIADDDRMTLADVSALGAVAVDHKIAVFVGSETETGVTQLVFDPGRVGETRGVPAGAYQGTSRDDIIVATPGTTAIRGGAGNDTLVAGVDGVTLTGGTGADLFVLSRAKGVISITDFGTEDRLDLSHVSGLRSLYGVGIKSTSHGALLRYGETEVRITSADGKPIAASRFTNEAFPTAHYDPRYTVTVIYGPDKPRTINADRGGSVIYGGARNDTLNGSLNPDWLGGGDGNDKIYARGGDDTIDGGTGHDSIEGMAGDDLIFGGAGNDTIKGGGGQNTIEGGVGDDRIYGGTGAGRLSGDEGNDTIFGAGKDDIIDGGAGNDRIWGNDGQDRISGGSGDDRILGGTGNDYIEGGDGNDTLAGGVGQDTIYGNDGNDLLSGGVGHDLIDGGNGHDTLWGGTGRDRLLGGAGNDSLFGEGDHDILSGGSGDDRLLGGDGNDTLYGGVGRDTLSGGTGDDLMKGDADNDRLYGLAGRDTLYGGAGHDLLLGHDGRDLLYGDDGRDTLMGGTGEDTLHGGEGADRLIGGDGADLLYGDQGDDFLYGELGDDRLIGGDGADSLHGGAGNDTLIGGRGADRLIGGAGADVFVFYRQDMDAKDVIAGFERGRDKIDLSDMGLRWRGTAPFTGAGQLRMDYADHKALLSADLNGDGHADFSIEVWVDAPLSQSDFIL